MVILSDAIAFTTRRQCDMLVTLNQMLRGTACWNKMSALLPLYGCERMEKDGVMCFGSRYVLWVHLVT